jgi:hypothetical protein
MRMPNGGGRRAIEGGVDFVTIEGVGNDFSSYDIVVFVEGGEADQ